MFGLLIRLWLLLSLFVLVMPIELASCETLVFEAENGILVGTEASRNRSGYSGESYVTGFDNDGDSVEVEFMLPCGGIYLLSIGYASPHGDKYNQVFVNGSCIGDKLFSQTHAFKTTTIGKVVLREGRNMIGVVKSWGWIDVDYVQIEPAEWLTLPAPIQPSLVNPYASKETKALMEYLTSIYGTKILAGQYDVQSILYVRRASGRLPAIGGFDLLHHSAGTSWKDNTPEQAIAWAKNMKGIVTISWHWVAPSGGNSFYTEETTFDVRKATTPGTKEHELITRDIDAIARQLKRLSDEGIPALWRPLHEAEGGWFWWGAHGAEPCMKLYKLLFERLTNYHKLDNLIWVWTSGTSEKSREWYPGDDYVDIVGLDVYLPDGNYDPLLDEFEKMVEFVQGKKLIAITENGPIPDPELLSKYNVGWLWFCTWGGGFIEDGSVNTREHIEEVYNHPYVVTLDELEWQGAIVQD